MEIDNSRIAPPVTTANDKGAPVDQRGKEAQTAAGDASKAQTSATDTVSLTGQARRLQELETEIAAQPVVDSQRVNAVRNAIENGSFTVNPTRIAEKMLSLEQAITDAR